MPQLAIHLNREVNEKGLLLNKQKHMLYSTVDSDNPQDREAEEAYRQDQQSDRERFEENEY